MSAYDTHHPSCRLRAVANPLYCGNWPELDHANCPSSVECGAITLEHLDAVCVCGPEREAEPEWLGHELRTPDAMLLDIISHTDKAIGDWLDNATRPRRPRGLLSCVWLDRNLDGTVAQSLGVQA
jgi:hypothetical protein